MYLFTACVDDPLGFFSAEEFYWPPPNCQFFVQMMGGLQSCHTIVTEVTRYTGMTLADICPVSCETCPEVPAADTACEACAPGKWASDIPAWTSTLDAGIRSACEACPAGMYRVSSYCSPCCACRQATDRPLRAGFHRRRRYGQHPVRLVPDRQIQRPSRSLFDRRLRR